MSLSSCERCWDNPCTCGFQYRNMLKSEHFKNDGGEKRLVLAAAVLGLPPAKLKEILGPYFSEKHPFEVLDYLHRLENFPNIDNYVVNPADREFGDTHPWVPARYLQHRNHPDMKNRPGETEPVKVQQLGVEAVEALQRFVFINRRIGIMDRVAVNILMAYGYRITHYQKPDVYYDNRWTITLKDKDFVLVFA